MTVLNIMNSIETIIVRQNSTNILYIRFILRIDELWYIIPLPFKTLLILKGSTILVYLTVI